MSKLIIGLLIIALLVILFLMFWIVVLSGALLFFGRTGQRKKRFLPGEQGTT
jgi:hypothetical protein